MAYTHNRHTSACGGFVGCGSGVHLCPLHLYSFLIKEERGSLYILGISAYYHDSAAALVLDGKVVAAAQEERFTRIKHDSSFPENAVKYCVEQAKIDAQDIDSVVFYEKPLLKFERLLETYLAFAPRGFTSFTKSIQAWASEKLFQKKSLISGLETSLGKGVKWKERLLFSEHHLSHAASAFFPSPFDDAAVLTIDAVGEWATTSIAVGDGDSLEIIEEMHFPHSLGMLYSAFTYYLGFKVNSGEYKVMGLAPYGEPKYLDLILEKLIRLKGDGSFALNMRYFDFATGLTMTNRKFNQLFGAPRREAESDLEQFHMDVASSLQAATESLVIGLAGRAAKVTGKRHLCLAGGVALNAVANGKLAETDLFQDLWIQPASGDAGGSIGAALAAWHLHFKGKRLVEPDKDSMSGGFLGPEYSSEEIELELNDAGAAFQVYETSELVSKVAEDINNGMAVGWMQGRMEFGPRALGNRSILADPRSTKMQKELNLKVKFRESFRPFAPSVLSERASEWFQIYTESPYMVIVSKLHSTKMKKMSAGEESLFGIEKLNIPRSEIPAVTHVDYSARVQTVDKNSGQLFRLLLEEFERISGMPMLVNTSFNVRGEPIVCSPTDAFKCFMGTGLDTLAIGNFYLRKKDQKESLRKDYSNEYELD